MTDPDKTLEELKAEMEDTQATYGAAEAAEDAAFLAYKAAREALYDTRAAFWFAEDAYNEAKENPDD